MEISTEELTAASTYFDCDLRSGLWNNLSAAQQKGALKMAKLDIMTLLKQSELDMSDALVSGAVFEQAVFLIEKQLSEVNGRTVASENIDGIGSTAYESRSGSALERNYASRALTLLEDNRKISVNLVR